MDTDSNIDIVGFKHSFTNLPGTEIPTFSVKFYSSSSESATSAEWQQIGYVQSSNNIIFLNDVKRYLKLEIQFDTESNLSSSNFLFLIQVNIDDISVPVITDHARNVLSKFPSWTKIYSDSLEKSTPELATPDTKAGAMVNALLGEDLDNVDRLIDDINLNSFISTADINEIAWLYVVPSVKPGFIKVLGDSIELARVSSYYELMQQSYNDFVFYYDFVTQEIYSIRPFTEVLVDQVSYEQTPVQNYNSFDELGLRVGLQRLYLESNLNFKKRILDVYKNPPSVDVEGLKKTLRRELDIWRAFGSTPDSNYAGATPEIIEISDFENNDGTYFSFEGNPNDSFFDLVERMNNRFPANLGYARWEETYWDYAGLSQEGVSSIPQTTDIKQIDDFDHQAGVGDFDDVKIVLEPVERDLEEYEFNLRIKGIKSDSTIEAYEPIKIAYDTYVSYYEPYVDNQSATVNYEVQLTLNAHGSIPQGAVYTASVVDYVKNVNNQNHPSSPEYIVREIFNPSLFASSDLRFVNSGSTPYFNTIYPSATESYYINQIPLYAVSQASVKYISSTNQSGATGSYAWIRFLDATPSTYAQTANATIVKTPTLENVDQLKLAISSKIWDPNKVRVSNTDKVRSSSVGNTLNVSGNPSQTNSINIDPMDLKKNFLLPYGADPIYVHIENVVTDSYTVDLSSTPNSGYGGVSHNTEDGVDYLIPSSPNIIAGFINPDFATPQFHENYISTSGSTVNYYFTRLKFPYDATPSSIFIEAASGPYYPFEQKVWTNFEAEHNTNFTFYMSENGIQKSSPDVHYEILDNNQGNLIGSYDIFRSDFGLEEYNTDPNLIVKSIEVINENDNILIWQENESDTDGSLNMNYFDEATGQYILKDINIRARYDLTSEKNISPSIRSGWYYQNGEERFVYAKPRTKIYSNINDINLEEVARNGSPLILDVQTQGSTPVQYRQVSFYDEATPSNYNEYNFEYITARQENVLYLAYSDVYAVEIKDTFTGQTIATNISSNTNQISSSLIPSNAPFVIGREYRVTYKVRRSFYVDNQDYDSQTDEYQTRIYIIDEPTPSYAATVTYESAVYDKDFEIPELKLNPLYSVLDEGYVFISHETYASDTADLNLSPKKIIANGIDYSILTIFSKDQNLNPKPYQSFSLQGQYLSATPNIVTTNDEGYGISKIYYSGGQQNVPYSTYLNVTGMDSSTPGSHQNSSSGLISGQEIIYLQAPRVEQQRLIAEADKKIVNADGLEKLTVYGKTSPNKKVYWRKSRNLHDAITGPYSTSAASPGQLLTSGMVQSDANGNFYIQHFIAQNDATPGYWFVVVDTESASTPNANPVTIAGDIIYWYEKYDANQASTEEPYYIPLANESSDYVPYNQDVVFKANVITNDVYYDENAATPWPLPIWYPINRYTQYQIGLLGSTPNQIESLSGIHPDYEEE